VSEMKFFLQIFIYVPGEMVHINVVPDLSVEVCYCRVIYVVECRFRMLYIVQFVTY